MSQRFYGAPPYRIVVVHGGPGAPGSAAGLARGISERYGALEPLQSKGGIDALVEELKSQIGRRCAEPVVLIGHSWGAWLAGLFAARHPAVVRKLILLGCGPLDVGYVGEIGLRRERNMSRGEYAEYRRLLSDLSGEDTPDRDEKLARLGAIAEKADGFDEVEDGAEAGDALPVDGALYAAITAEAMRLRESGRLLAEFLRIKCPVVLIQGDADSHPHKGVTEPLSKHGFVIRTHILEKCGHTPWKERHARDAFYRILFDELR